MNNKKYVLQVKSALLFPEAKALLNQISGAK